jgi:hypothetical protein
MFEKSFVKKIISLQKGGDSIMKKVLGLSLMVVLLASGAFAAFTSYSYLTSLANNVPGDGGNKVNGCVVYNPELNAVFTGEYFTGVGSRAVILGWSLNPADPTYGTTTPKYIIRDRMFPNGLQLTALKSMFGNAEYFNGKLHFVCDRWGFDSLNMVGRTWCTVNADSVSVTYPFVTSDCPLYNVTGVSSSASTIVEDTWGGAQLYAGATTAFLTTTSGAVGFGQFVLPGNADNMLVGVTGIWTNAYTLYTRQSTTSSDATTVTTVSAIKSGVAITGVYTNSGGLGLNFAAATTVTRESTVSLNSTQVQVSIIPVNTVTGVWTNSGGLGFNFYVAPGNGFTSGGLVTINSNTTIAGAGVSVWVSYTAQAASVSLPNTIFLNGPPLAGAGTSVWVTYGSSVLDNVGTPTGIGTNFYTGGGYDEAPCVVWPGASITGSPTTVYAAYSLGQVNPNTGVIKLNPLYPQPPGNSLFVHVGQLQPGHRAVWRYNATTLAAETALNIYGHPVMWEASTVVSVNIATPGIGTTYQIGGFSAPMTDQFLVGKVKGADTGRSRLTYTNYGAVTVGPIVSASATNFNIALAGKPYSGFYGVWTNASGLGTNFWSSPSPAAWVAITDTTKIELPGWLPIRKSVSISTGGTSAFTRESTSSVSGTVINTLKAPIVSCSGVWTNAAGLGNNFAAATTVTRESTVSTSATQCQVSSSLVNSVTGVWTNSGGLGFNYYVAPGNTFTTGGLVTINSNTTFGGAGVSVWVTYTAQAATVSLPNVITLNATPLPGGPGSAAWSSYVISGIDPTGTVTAAGTNFFTGRVGAADTTSQKGAGGPGGWWSIAIDTPTIYAYVGGIDTTLSLGSAFVNYLGEPPDNYNYFNLMDTTGDIILTNPLPGPGTSVWVGYNRANGLDIANNLIQVVSVGNTPTLAVGDTVYTCYLKQAGANPYNYTGAGTAGNRSVTANPYGMTIDKDGNYFVTTLWSYNGFCALDAAGNNWGRYPMRGSQSQVIRGQISCNTTNGDIYYADGNGIVWRYKKTGPGLDTYVQDNEPFYLGACYGTNGIAFRATSSALRVKTVLSAFDNAPVTLVYLGTPRDNNATTEGTDLITIMDTNGNVVNRWSHPLGGYATPRGMDVAQDLSLTWPNRDKILVGGWAGPAGYGKVMVWQGYAVPVELSRFESFVN